MLVLVVKTENMVLMMMMTLKWRLFCLEVWRASLWRLTLHPKDPPPTHPKPHPPSPKHHPPPTHPHPHPHPPTHPKPHPPTPNDHPPTVEPQNPCLDALLLCLCRKKRGDDREPQLATEGSDHDQSKDACSSKREARSLRRFEVRTCF